LKYAKIIRAVLTRARRDALHMGAWARGIGGGNLRFSAGYAVFRWSGHREDVDVHHPCGGAEAGCRLRGIITPNLFSVTGFINDKF